MRSRAHGFTLVELMIVVGVISVLASISVPVLIRARIAGNEASAIGSLRTIVSAQGDYFAMNAAYGESLTALSTTCPGLTAPYVSSDLDANGVLKSGYTFAVVPGLGGVARPNDVCGTPMSSAYYATATPVSVGMSGGRGFASDANFALWEDSTGVPPAQPFAISATVVPLGR